MAPAERYSRQVRFAPIGPAGQERLLGSRVVILGCGALGSAVAEQLARAGVGYLRLVDRDFVEPSNLGRQCLYTEADAREALPKAVAAVRRLGELNGGITLDPVVTHVSAANVCDLVAGCDLAVDGGDNFALRHLLNEACCQAGIPWIYGACVEAYGCSMPVLPGETACLRCLQDELPAAGDGPTCDTVGVIAPAVHLVASWQVAEVLKLLVGDRAAVRRELWGVDLWRNRHQRIDSLRWRDPACPACGADPSYPALQQREEPPVVLCGRDGLQLRGEPPDDLAAFRDRIGRALVATNSHLVRWRDGDLLASLFRDGRLIVQGTADEGRARALRDRWLG